MTHGRASGGDGPRGVPAAATSDHGGRRAPVVARALRSTRSLVRILLGALGAVVTVAALLAGDELGLSERGRAQRAAETSTSTSQPERARHADRRGVPGAGALDPRTLMPSDPDASVVAHATVDLVTVHDAPERSAAVRALRHPTENGSPLVFLVERRRPDGWLEVQLPVRPNGSTGWVREDDVDLRQHRYRITVEIGARELRVHHDGELVMRSPVGVGARDTPTPGGTFYVKELLRPPRPDTVYGPYAFGLSGFSNTLEQFAGGEGVIGIHGTNDPDAIGREVSAGCIRLPNEQIEELVGVIPLGTPVTIER